MRLSESGKVCSLANVGKSDDEDEADENGETVVNENEETVAPENTEVSENATAGEGKTEE